ncbi:MAG: hypothetical protein Q8O22_04740 [Candidatus Omnitrophota bacterium]|nr:hypothetical protein [Candidatus Omnitrophota bacterium]
MMRTRKTALIVVLLLIAAATIGLFAQMPLEAQATEEAVSARLDELLAGQKTILQEIRAIKDELDGIRNQTNKL